MAIEDELELSFPTHTVKHPILCEMGRRHNVVFNIISADVSQHLGRFRFRLLGDEAEVKAAERYLTEQGVGVTVVSSGPYKGVVPVAPPRQPVRPGEPRVARKLWITFMDDVRRGPMTWEMSSQFDVTFDIRQSSTGDTVNIMALLLEGPASHVDGAIAFLREHGVEVEPIEKSVVEG